MKPQITKAFFPSGQFKNRKGKKTKKQKKKHLIQNQEKGLWATRLWGCPPTGPTAAFVQRTVRRQGPQTVCLGWGRALVTCVHRPKGRDADSCTSAHHHGSGPPVHPSKCQREPSPTPVHKTPPFASTVARLFEGQLGKEPQTSLFQNRILACSLVEFLFLACCCFYFYFLRKNKEKKTAESSTREPVCSRVEPAGQGPSRTHHDASIPSPGI